MINETPKANTENTKPPEQAKDNVRQEVIRAASDTSGLKPEKLSEERQSAEKDITESLSPESKQKLWNLVTSTFKAVSKEYDTTDNFRPEKATFKKSAVQSEKPDEKNAVITVYVTGKKSGSVIQLPSLNDIGTVDAFGTIAFNEKYRNDPPLNKECRDDISKCFKEV